MKNKTLALIVFAMIIIVFAMVTLSGWIDQRLGMAIVLGLVVLFDVVVAILAYRSGVFAIFLLMLLFAIVGLSVCGFNVYMFTIPVKPEINYYLEVNSRDNTKDELYIQNGSHFYTLGVTEPSIVNESDGSRESLKNALTNGHITLDKILSGAIKDDKGNGNAIYYDGGLAERENDEYSVVVCSNADVVFAPYEYTYQEDICS